MRPRSLPVAVALLSAAAVAAPARQADPTAAELARRLQARYDTIRDFTAEFTATYRSRLLRRTSVERGDLRIKKPGRMRWTYTAPERKELVADGRDVYWYVAEDNTVTIAPIPQDREVSTAVLFLAGRGDVVRDFTASLVPTAPAGEWHLRLAPKALQADFTTLTLQLDRPTLALLGLVVDDDQGTSAYRFSRLRENVGLADRDFVFRIPPNAEIIR